MKFPVSPTELERPPEIKVLFCGVSLRPQIIVVVNSGSNAARAAVTPRPPNKTPVSCIAGSQIEATRSGEDRMALPGERNPLRLRITGLFSNASFSASASPRSRITSSVGAVMVRGGRFHPLRGETVGPSVGLESDISRFR